MHIHPTAWQSIRYKHLNICESDSKCWNKTVEMESRFCVKNHFPTVRNSLFPYRQRGFGFLVWRWFTFYVSSHETKTITSCSSNQFIVFCLKRWNEPAHEILVLYTYATSEGLGEPVHPRSLATAFAVRTHELWKWTKIRPIGPLGGCACAFENEFTEDENLMSQIPMPERFMFPCS